MKRTLSGVTLQYTCKSVLSCRVQMGVFFVSIFFFIGT